MSEEIKDRIKSFVLGIVLPLPYTFLAGGYMTGACTRTRKGRPLTPPQAFAYGLTYLGVALCLHASFYERYDNHPAVKYAIIAIGLVFIFLGIYRTFT